MIEERPGELLEYLPDGKKRVQKRFLLRVGSKEVAIPQSLRIEIRLLRGHLRKIVGDFHQIFPGISFPEYNPRAFLEVIELPSSEISRSTGVWCGSLLNETVTDLLSDWVRDQQVRQKPNWKFFTRRLRRGERQIGQALASVFSQELTTNQTVSLLAEAYFEKGTEFLRDYYERLRAETKIDAPSFEDLESLEYDPPQIPDWLLGPFVAATSSARESEITLCLAPHILAPLAAPITKIILGKGLPLTPENWLHTLVVSLGAEAFVMGHIFSRTLIHEVSHGLSLRRYKGKNLVQIGLCRRKDLS